MTCRCATTAIHQARYRENERSNQAYTEAQHAAMLKQLQADLLSKHND